jgi:hypothetical protein
MTSKVINIQRVSSEQEEIHHKNCKRSKKKKEVRRQNSGDRIKPFRIHPDS